jgi:hypothetical protein
MTVIYMTVDVSDLLQHIPDEHWLLMVILLSARSMLFPCTLQAGDHTGATVANGSLPIMTELWCF